MKRPKKAAKAEDKAALIVAGVFLILVGAVYLIHGAYALFTQAGDYHMHWAEQRYVWRGVNPGDVYARFHAEQELGVPAPVTDRPNAIDPALGPVDGAYPLSSYFTAAFLTWPSPFGAGRALNGIISLVLFAVVLAWSYRRGDEAERGFGWVLAAAVFAVNSFCTTMIVGQYGILVMGTVVGAFCLDRDKRWLLAGLCLGVALIKPSVALPFVLPFLIRQRWKMLLVAGAYLLVGTLVIWPWIDTTPWQALAQMSAMAERFQGAGYSTNNLLEYFGVPPQPAMKISALGVIAVEAALIWRWRQSSMVTLFGIAALASRAWSYHRQYDNLVLAFLLVAVGVTAVRRQSLAGAAAFLALGLSLWLPARFTMSVEWTVAQWAVWIGALVVLLALEPRTSREEPAVEERPGALTGVTG